MKMNENESITVTALSTSRTFADREALAEHVREIVEDRHAFDLKPIEIAAIRRFAELNGAATPRVREIARTTTFYAPKRPKRATKVDGRVAETKAEVEVDEVELADAQEVEWSRARESDAEAVRRMRKAAGNPTKLSRAEAWIDARQAEVAELRLRTQLAAQKLRMARARLNALELVQGRLRAEQEVRVSVEGETLTLEQFEAWKGNR